MSNRGSKFNVHYMQLQKYHNDPPLYNKYTLIKNKTTEKE
jgi:hypothetical protein